MDARTETGGSPQELVVERLDDFRVNGEVYTSPEIFAQEMELIFGQTWVYVAHESEVPSHGDFVTSYIGLRPVIVSRDEDGNIHVLLNRCRHRGAALCRLLKGNMKYFTCNYHGWTYRTDGKLLTIPLQKGGYPDSIDKDSLSLMPVPRVANYRGLIFASMATDGPTLIEHLGSVKRYLDHQLDHSPIGKIELRRGAHRTQYAGNWKFQAENSTDGYHGNFVHYSFWKILAKFGNRGGQHGNYSETDMTKILKRRDTGRTKGMENGHGILEYPMPGQGIDGLLADPDHREYMQSMERAYGRQRLEEILPQYNVWIFPNLGVLLDQIRVVRPVSPDLTEVTLQFYDLEDVPSSYNQMRFEGYERFFGPASFGSPDDVEMFATNQTGLQAKEAKWLVLSRGIEREQIEDGIRIGHPTDETPQRAFYRKWRAMMEPASDKWTTN